MSLYVCVCFCHTDRALVVNGLNIVGKKLFCSQLAQKLERESLDIIGDFVLPEEHALPSFRYVNTKVLLNKIVKTEEQSLHLMLVRLTFHKEMFPDSHVTLYRRVCVLLE